MKVCFKCRQAKPITEFYKHSAMEDGHLGKCKNCARQDATAYRAARIEHWRAYDRARGNRQIGYQYGAKQPERRAAQVALGNAVRDGKVTPLPCLICGEKAEAHHPDYSAPLDVIWLCPAHHKQAHAMTRKAA
jgi:hypothetical protein